MRCVIWGKVGTHIIIVHARHLCIYITILLPTVSAFGSSVCTATTKKHIVYRATSAWHRQVVLLLLRICLCLFLCLCTSVPCNVAGVAVAVNVMWVFVPSHIYTVYHQHACIYTYIHKHAFIYNMVVVRDVCAHILRVWMCICARHFGHVRGALVRFSA